MEQLQALLEGGDVRSLKTEYTTLDQLTGGFQPGELIVVAARPSMGKSTLALNMLLRIIERHGIASLLVTLEMGSDQIVRNMLSIKSRVSLHKTDEDGKGGGTFLTTDEWEQLNYAAGLIEWIPLYIDFSANMTLSRLRAVARRLKQHHDRGASQGNAEERLEPFGLIVIDYLQLLRVEGFGPSERQQMIGEISRGLKSLARELEVPVKRPTGRC
jgi:replicative DNA helicase